MSVVLEASRFRVSRSFISKYNKSPKQIWHPPRKKFHHSLKRELIQYYDNIIVLGLFEIPECVTELMSIKQL